MPLLKEKEHEFCIKKSTRYPNLVTLIMIEKTIEKYSGELNARGIWKKLPKKVMWQTFMIAISYLEHISKIGIAKNGILVYIWNPKLTRKYINRMDLR